MKTENEIIFEENSKMNINSDDENTSTISENNDNDKEENLEKNIKKEELKKKRKSKKSCFVQKSFKHKSIFEIKKLQNNIPPNKIKDIKLGKNDLDNRNLDKLIRLMNNNEIFMQKCKKLQILDDLIDQKFYDIINYELDNIRNNIESIKLNNPDTIESARNYIENGLLIPIIFYFKKIFSLIHFFSGEDMIKIFCLIEKSIKLKLYLSEFKIDLWSYTLKENINLEDNKNIYLSEIELNNSKYNFLSKYKNPSLINPLSFINKNSINSSYESLKNIKSGYVSLFDYTFLYQIIDKEFFYLIKERKILNIIRNIKMNNNKTLNKKMKEEEILLFKKTKNNISDINKRLLKALIIYKNTKLLTLNENNSSFLNILSEITLDYKANYRNLIIRLLIDYGIEKNIKDEFTDISYFLLFKLLSLQTSDIQNDLINILEGKKNNDSDILKDFIHILFYRIILLFVEYLNPSDKLIQSNYFTSCNLIFIFKYLCKEHNNYFQRYFINNISFSFNENNHPFFAIKKEDESQNSISSDEESAVKNIVNKENKINFFGFLLNVLTKIILISNWENHHKYDSQHQNPFLFDLFSSILDLISEIIQGCKPDLLNNLCVNFEDDSSTHFIEDGENLDKYKKIDSFENFVRTIKNILFNQNHNSKFINELKSNIILFITSILEENNCNEMMKKYIKKYININRVFKVIGIIMKSYYLIKEKSKSNNLDITKNTLNDNNLSDENDINKLGNKNENNIFKRNSSYYKPIFRPKIKIFKYLESKRTLDADTSSNLRLMNNSTFSYKNINNKNHFLNFENKYNHNKLRKNEKENYNTTLIKNTIQNKETNNKVSKILESELSNVLFGKKLYNYFKGIFFKSNDFIESLEFQLSNSFYRYIKIINVENENQKDKLFIKQIIDFEENSISDQNLKENSNFDKDLFEMYYIEKFFEDITRNVEIRTNEGIKSVIYTKLPLMQYLSKETKIEFNENINRDSELSKKYDILRYLEYFIKEIKYYKKKQNNRNIWILNIDFYYLNLLS